MELIVRTAHGVAEVAFDALETSITLHDLLGAITGQAAPSAALVDGTIVDTSLPIGECQLLNGSIIETDLGRTSPRPLARTNILQLTGTGAGTIRPLDVGTYRIGPGRRVHADELELATVESAIIQIDVGSARTVVSAGPSASVKLDGDPLIEETVWSNGLLTVDGRTFALDQSLAATKNQVRPVSTSVDADGYILFNRPPGEISEQRLLTIDAIRDATGDRAALWHQRIGENTSWTVDVGLIPDSNVRAHIDFDTDRVVAIAGDPASTMAHGRALLIEMVTRFGPSDLEVIIAATPEQLGDWDWAKWLPHSRVSGGVAILSNELELATFAQQRTATTGSRALLVVTHDQLWAEADAPLRSLVLDGPAHMGVLVLTASATNAPASSGSLIDHNLDGVPAGTARLVRVARSGAEMTIHAPLLSMNLAAETARRLAPLRDPDLKVEGTDRPAGASHTLSEFVGFDGHDNVNPTSWNRARQLPDASAALPIGVLANTSLEIDIGTNRGVVVSGSSIDEATDLVRTLALSMAAAWSPADLAIITVDHSAAHVDDPLQHLPHNAGRFAHRGAPAGLRFAERLRNDLAAQHESGRRLVVIVNGPSQTELATPGLLAMLSDIAQSQAASGHQSSARPATGFHLIVATHLPLASLDSAVRDICSLEITIDRVGGLRRATLHNRQNGFRTPFTPFETQPFKPNALHVRPMVFGRPLTALERQLERRATSDSATRAGDDQIERLVRDLCEHSTQLGIVPVASVVPQALPDELDSNDLFMENRGDGIPLGMVERLDGGDPEMYWWQPGVDGSRLLVGSPRSGIRSSVDAIIRGAIERFSADDLHLYVIDQSDSRRRSIAACAHVGGVASPDRDADVDALLDVLHNAIEQRTNDGYSRSSDLPTLLLIVRDIDRLNLAAMATLQTIVNNGSKVGIFVAATATRYGEIADVVSAFQVVIVGELTNPNDYASLGVDEPEALVRHRGRCISVPDQRLVQLGAPSEPLESILRNIASEAATSYPPVRPKDLNGKTDRPEGEMK